MHEQRNDNTPLTLVHLQALKYKEKMQTSFRNATLAGSKVRRRLEQVKQAQGKTAGASEAVPCRVPCRLKR
jgi:hypothetical protein